MATWIGHLRIAENLLPHIAAPDARHFALGSLAPDCGRKSEDGQGFIPPKEISHYVIHEGDRLVFEDLRFYRRYLKDLHPADDPSRHSFLLAYFIHLTVDGLWYEKVGVASKRDYANLLAERGQEAWWIMKDDWYGLDVQYVLDNPDCLFWRELMPLDKYPEFLPFQESSAINEQIDFIRGFYTNPPLDLIEKRQYPYLNEATMDRFIDDATEHVVKVLDLVGKGSLLSRANCSLDILPPSYITPYPPPLGD